MNKICGNCKYKGEMVEENFTEWKADIEVVVEEMEYFLCERIEHISQYTRREGTSAFVVDGSDYFAALRVSNDFGCKAWEQSDE
jgi:hypothetical protein